MQGERHIAGVPLSLLNSPWVKRAFDPHTATTEKNETIRSATYTHEGNDILVPTIRKRTDGTLYHVRDPYKTAIEENDFYVLPSGSDPTAISQRLSSLIELQRNTAPLIPKRDLPFSDVIDAPDGPLQLLDREGPGFGKAFKAAMEEFNVAYAGIDLLARALLPEQVYNDNYAHLKNQPVNWDNPFVKANPRLFLGAENEWDVFKRTQRRKRHLANMNILQDAGVEGVAASLLAVVGDVPLFSGFSTARMLARAGNKRGAAIAASETMATTAIAESILLARSDNWEMAEIGLTLGTFIGAASYPILRNGRVFAGNPQAEKRWREKLSELDDPPVGGSASRTDPPGRPPSAAGAAGTPGSRAQRTVAEEMEGEAMIASGIGLEKLPDSPFKRGLQSSSLRVRELTTELVETPGIYQNKHRWGEANPLSVETNARQNNFPLMEAVSGIQGEWLKMRGASSGSALQNIGQTVRLSATDLAAQIRGGSGEITLTRFREEVSTALRSGGNHPNEYVRNGAALAREKVFMPLLKAGQETEVFTSHIRSSIYRIEKELETLEKMVTSYQKRAKTLSADIDKLQRRTDLNPAAKKDRLSKLQKSRSLNAGKLKTTSEKYHGEKKLLSH